MDGASMMQYQFPSRVAEVTFCRGHACEGQHGFDPELVNFPVSAFEVKPSVVANGGRGVFAKVFVPKGSLIGLEDCVHGMFSPSRTVELMERAGAAYGASSEFWNVVDTAYFDGYGWSESFYVSTVVLLCVLLACARVLTRVVRKPHISGLVVGCICRVRFPPASILGS
jgi:hypothetical protein